MTQTPDLEIPAILKRETNAKGVTLSAGVTTDPVTVEATKSKPAKAPKAAKAVKEPKVATVAGLKAAQKKATAPKADKPRVTRKAAPAKTGTVIDPATGEPVVKVVRSIVPMRFKDRYAKHGGTCGDDMALELKAATTMLNADKRETLDLEALKAIAAQNGIDTAKYAGLNNGQWRMNVGNKLRGKLAAGENVKVGKRVFKAEDYAPRG